ncbi:MAG TPA: sulfite exporter TauE/SafE family protein [Alcanivorax sp.]|nr:sulfite exporter TauE/SafE family protein [Alcanivorax sp.]
MTLVLICALIGVFAGLLGGALGLGGGVVIVPPLIYLFHALGFDDAVVAQMAVGTSLATIIVTAGSSVRAHHVAGFVRWPLAWRLAGGIVVGALIGAVIADRLSGAALTRLFGVFAVLIAAQMLLSRRRGARVQVDLPERVPGSAGLAGVGSVIGTVSSLFGIGGGSLTVPFLSWCRLPMQNAVAISAACGLPIALAGSAGFVATGWGRPELPPWSLGYVYLPAALAIVVTSFPMARVGARLSHRLPSATLRRIFAGILIVIGVELILN